MNIPAETVSKSRSQKKREADSLQALGAFFCKGGKLPSGINYPPQLITAINNAKKINSPGGYRRELQLIGKLMRQWNEEFPQEVSALQDSIESARSIKSKDNKIEKAAKKWSDEIINDSFITRENNLPKALLKFVDIYPQVDNTKIVHLLGEIKNDRNRIKYVRRELLKIVFTTISNN